MMDIDKKAEVKKIYECEMQDKSRIYPFKEINQIFFTGHSFTGLLKKLTPMLTAIIMN